MSELTKANIAQRISTAAPGEHERTTLEEWLADGMSRDLDDSVQVKLRLPLKLRQALDRAASITGKSKNALMTQFILEGLRRLHTYEQSTTAKRGRGA